MALENLIAYAIVLGLPFWLVAEEILHRFGSRLARPSTAQTGLERRAPAGAPSPSHVHNWVS